MNISGAKARAGLCKKAQAQKKHRVCARYVFGGKLSGRQRLCMEFLLGGVGYGLLELLWRGETHWSMVLTGGACLVAICAVNKRLRGKSVFLRAGVCAAAITALEFAVGMVVNRWLGMSVWDYSGMFGNVLGQICPLYSLLWFLLCVPLCGAVCAAMQPQLEVE
ncbi:MAG: hypothetical protein IJW21_06260 [Clostridia bacterium]|nr:hypothetical protein [Clostridia bacterium]